MERNRQTGRSSRIVNHVTEQLFSVGGCISTDHVFFEFDNLKSKNLRNFIDRVRRRVETESGGLKTIDFEIVKVVTSKEIVPAVYFKIELCK